MTIWPREHTQATLGVKQSQTVWIGLSLGREQSQEHG